MSPQATALLLLLLMGRRDDAVGGARLLRAARHRLRVEVQTLAALRLRLERVARNGGCANERCTLDAGDATRVPRTYEKYKSVGHNSSQHKSHGFTRHCHKFLARCRYSKLLRLDLHVTIIRCLACWHLRLLLAP